MSQKYRKFAVLFEVSYKSCKVLWFNKFFTILVIAQSQIIIVNWLVYKRLTSQKRDGRESSYIKTS
jgi:hypothetical protein